MKKVLPYVLSTLLLSWFIAGVAYFIGLTIYSVYYAVFAILYMFLPAVCAVLFQRFRDKESIHKPLLISFKLKNNVFLIAWVTPMVITLLTLLIGIFIPETHFIFSFEEAFLTHSPSPDVATPMIELVHKISPVGFLLLTLIQSAFAGISINALAAFGEELGWRGYMLIHLKGWSFMKGSLLIGFVWGIWHFPLILMGHNYPHHPMIGVVFMTIFCMLISPLLSYFVIKSRSVIPAAIFHGTINAFAGFVPFFLTGSNELIKGLTGVTGFMAIFIVTFGFYLYDRFVTKECIFSRTLS